MNYFVFRYTSKLNQTLGFTKRRINEADNPKWIHSKKENSKTDMCAQCYGLGKASKAIKKTGHCIFVEGVKDTIPYILSGIKEVVSLSGTHHFKTAYTLLCPTSITLALDADNAGRSGMKDIAMYLADKHDLSQVTWQDFMALDPYDYYQQYKELPQEQNIFDLFSQEELKNLFAASNHFNKGLIVSYFIKRFKINYEATLSYFAMGNQDTKTINETQELQILQQNPDKESLEKIRLKYGIV